MNYIYLILELIVVGILIFLSYRGKTRFINQLATAAITSLLITIFCNTLSFILSEYGIIGFNEKFTVGLSLFGIPIEEILFYFIFPFFTLFIYEKLKFHLRQDQFNWTNSVLKLLIPLFILGVVLIEKSGLYTVTVISLTTIVFIIWGFFSSLSKIGITYFVCVIPYILTRAALLSTESSSSMIWHNETQQVSMKIAGIPPEEFLDGFSLIVVSIILYEIVQKIRYK